MNVILVIFLLLGMCYLVWLLFNYFKSNFCRNSTEHFTQLLTASVGQESNVVTSEADYDSRLNVIKVFDTVLHRKATPEELIKYGAIQNEQDILVAVLADFQVKEEFEDAPSITPALATMPIPFTPMPAPAQESSSSSMPTVSSTIEPPKTQVAMPSVSTPATTPTPTVTPYNPTLSNVTAPTTNTAAPAVPATNPAAMKQTLVTNLDAISTAVANIRNLMP